MLKRLLTVHDITNDNLLCIFRQADAYRELTNYVSPPTTRDYSQKIMLPLFLEPSTRTRHSFESAMLRLGGKCLSSPTPEMMSRSKGESTLDTLNVESHYCDLMVVRANEHFENWFDSDSKVPVINAGDGQHNHPTQAILDAYTIWRLCDREDEMSPFIKRKMNHLIIGDVGHSRAIRSYWQLLSRAEGHQFYSYDSTGLFLTIPFINDSSCKINYIAKHEINDLLPSIDIIYLNRVQKERWPKTGSGWKTINTPFSFHENMFDLLKPNCIILNPGPRQEELESHLAKKPQVKISDQVENGLYIRMAIISKIIGHDLPCRQNT